MLTARSAQAVSSPPITRNSLLWLCAIQIFVLVPHFSAVAGWIPLVWGAVIFWRWKIFQGAWNYPNKLQKTLVVALCGAGLWLSLGANFSLTAMLSLLLVGSILKLLEIKTRKDFVLLIFLSLFILAAQFIFFNHFLAAFYGFFCLLLLCAALLQLYQTAPAKNLWWRLRPVLFMLLQALPVMAVMFVVMPRIGAFWSVPAPPHATIGMSDSMAPGDFAKLADSDELAFRVVFTAAGAAGAAMPPREILYWRSLIFSNFDGRRWYRVPVARSQLQSSAQRTSGWREKMDYGDERISYEIIAEPSAKTWLYSLAAPQRWSDDILLGPDLSLQARLPIMQRTAYSVTSALTYSDAAAQGPEIAQLNLHLPQWGNPETRKIAKAWLAEVGTREKLIEKLFAYYRSDFFYTLTPPALGDNSVDEFLWRSRQGFCEHFAGSFVFFMRAAGIPARVVVGYLGGELNPQDSSLTLYQRDAHAWAEVWIAERGWVRYDPTDAVAPERIRGGVVEPEAPIEQGYLGKSLAVSYTLFSNIQQRWSALNLRWVRWVMNYDSGLQSQLLSWLLREVTPWRLVVCLLLAVMLSGLVTFALLFARGRRALPRKDREIQLLYRQLCRKLEREGFVPQVGEAPGSFAARVIDARPDLKPRLSVIIKLYEQLVYGENPSVLPALKQQLAHFLKTRSYSPESRG